MQTLLQLADSPWCYFGYKNMICHEVFDLKTQNNKFKVGLSSKFPNVMYGKLNTSFIEDKILNKAKDKYFKIENDKVSFAVLFAEEYII